MFTNALCFNIYLSEYYWLSNICALQNSKENLRRVAAKIDFFLSFLFLYAVVIRCFVVRICWHVESWMRTKSGEAGHIYFLRGAIGSLRLLSSAYSDHCINKTARGNLFCLSFPRTNLTCGFI